jgi:hypothetical protein
MRFLEFCVANIRNLHTRRAYTRAADNPELPPESPEDLTS